MATARKEIKSVQLDVFVLELSAVEAAVVRELLGFLTQASEDSPYAEPLREVSRAARQLGVASAPLSLVNVAHWPITVR